MGPGLIFLRDVATITAQSGHAANAISTAPSSESSGSTPSPSAAAHQPPAIRWPRLPVGHPEMLRVAR